MSKTMKIPLAYLRW